MTSGSGPAAVDEAVGGQLEADPVRAAHEIAEYLAGVRAALADLPVEARDDLVEDLPEHLAEVRAEDTGSLVERLGAPAAYAADLRLAAGLSPTTDTPAKARRLPELDRIRRRIRPITGWLRQWTAETDVLIGRVVGHDRGTDFLRLLRPAWWLLRGYAIGMIVLAVFVSDSGSLLPSAGGSTLIGLAVVGPFMAGSVRVGSLAGRLAGRWRLISRIATAALALLIVGSVVDASDDSADLHYSPTDGYGGLVDIYPYGRDGQPLNGVRLYDQDGHQLELGNRWGRCYSYAPDALPVYEYPLCPLVPNAVQPSGPVPSGSPSPAPSGSVAPAPSGSAPSGPAPAGAGDVPSASVSPGANPAGPAAGGAPAPERSASPAPGPVGAPPPSAQPGAG